MGQLARPVASVAAELGVCWWTVMDAVDLHGTPLADDPDRVGTVRALGIDETSFLSANRDHATLYATGLVDLTRRILIDMVEGNSATDLRRWCARQDPAWLRDIRIVATDLAESYRAGTSPHLDHVTRVADPFHWSAWPTAASIRSAGGSRTRRSLIAAGKTILSIGSASGCSQGPSDSTSEATTACCGTAGGRSP